MSSASILLELVPPSFTDVFALVFILLLILTWIGLGSYLPRI